MTIGCAAIFYWMRQEVKEMFSSWRPTTHMSLGVFYCFTWAITFVDYLSRTTNTIRRTKEAEQDKECWRIRSPLILFCVSNKRTFCDYSEFLFSSFNRFLIDGNPFITCEQDRVGRRVRGDRVVLSNAPFFSEPEKLELDKFGKSETWEYTNYGWGCLVMLEQNSSLVSHFWSIFALYAWWRTFSRAMTVNIFMALQSFMYKVSIPSFPNLEFELD